MSTFYERDVLRAALHTHIDDILVGFDTPSQSFAAIMKLETELHPKMNELALTYCVRRLEVQGADSSFPKRSLPC